MISKWSFEAQGPTSPSPPSAKPQSTSNGKAQSNGKTPAKLKVQATFLNRLKFAWNSTMSIRNVNTPHEIRNTPYFSSTNPSYIPSRSRFLIRSLATFTITYLLLDLMESAPPPPDLTLFNPSHVPVFTRLNEITFEEVVTRIVTSGVVWLAAFCIIATWNAFLEFFFVGTGLSEPKSWRPLFGSFAETYTVRGFWGYVSLPLPLPYPHSPSRKLTTRTANSGTNSSVNPTPTPPPISSTVSSIFQKVYYPAI